MGRGTWMQKVEGGTEDGRGFAIAIVLSGIGAGGTERVVSMLANRLARNGWRVTIITPEATDAQSYYPFDSSVDIVRLGLPAARYGRFRGRWVAIRRILGLRRVFARLKPDVILSFLTRTNVQRSEEHTSELQSLMRFSYAVFCLKNKTI